jgi:hypothetical protein
MGRSGALKALSRSAAPVDEIGDGAAALRAMPLVEVESPPSMFLRVRLAGLPAAARGGELAQIMAMPPLT